MVSLQCSGLPIIFGQLGIRFIWERVLTPATSNSPHHLPLTLQKRKDREFSYYTEYCYCSSSNLLLPGFHFFFLLLLFLSTSYKFSMELFCVIFSSIIKSTNILKTNDCAWKVIHLFDMQVTAAQTKLKRTLFKRNATHCFFFGKFRLLLSNTCTYKFVIF